jgi:RNA recognition motif-containing protein
MSSSEEDIPMKKFPKKIAPAKLREPTKSGKPDLAFLEENKKIFVGLDKQDGWGGEKWAVTDQQFRDVFSAIGEVKMAHVVKDKATGIGKGFGFVQFKDSSSVEKAIALMNKSELGGKKIIVRSVEERFDQRRADAKANGETPAEEGPKKKRKRYHKNNEKQAEKLEEIDLLAGFATVTRAQKDAGVVTAPIFVKQIGGTTGVGTTFTCAAADVTGFDPQTLLAQKRSVVIFGTAEVDGEQRAVELRKPTDEETKKIDLLLKSNPQLKSHNSKARLNKKVQVKQEKNKNRKVARAKARAEALEKEGGDAAAGGVKADAAGGTKEGAEKAKGGARKEAAPETDEKLSKEERKLAKAAAKEAKKAEKEATKAAEKEAKQARKAEKKAKKEGKKNADSAMEDAAEAGGAEDMQKQLEAEMKKQQKLQASLQSLLGI